MSVPIHVKYYRLVSLSLCGQSLYEVGGGEDSSARIMEVNTDTYQIPWPEFSSGRSNKQARTMKVL